MSWVAPAASNGRPQLWLRLPAKSAARPGCATSAPNGANAAAVTGSTISGNSATYQGGGIDHYTVGALTVEDSSVSGNTAKDIGGILDESVSTGPLTISDSAISGNTGVSFGGGLAVYRVGGASRIEDTTVAGNHSTGEGGNSYAGLAAGVNLDLYAGSSLTISGTTIAGNDAAVAGGVEPFSRIAMLAGKRRALSSASLGNVSSSRARAGGDGLARPAPVAVSGISSLSSCLPCFGTPLDRRGGPDTIS